VRSQAVLNYKVADLVLGPGQDGKQISPEGLKVSAMTDKQRAMLLQLIAEWAGIMNDAMASARMAQLKSDLNDTWCVERPDRFPAGYKYHGLLPHPGAAPGDRVCAAERRAGQSRSHDLP
jgi:hypothetical protein